MSTYLSGDGAAGRQGRGRGGVTMSSKCCTVIITNVCCRSEFLCWFGFWVSMTVVSTRLRLDRHVSEVDRAREGPVPWLRHVVRHPRSRAVFTIFEVIFVLFFLLLFFTHAVWSVYTIIVCVCVCMVGWVVGVVSGWGLVHCILLLLQ